MSNYISFDSCEVKHQGNFENTDEPLPLTAHGYNYVVCQAGLKMKVDNAWYLF